MRQAVDGKLYLPVGCHGKLPFWPEYLDVNVALPVSRAFRDWIRDGRSAAGMGPDSQDGKVPPETSRLRFVYAPAGDPELLVGVIRPSADIGGKRPFPFSVFVHVPKRHWSRSYALLPMALAPVWDALDDVWDSVATAASEPAFREILAAARVPAPLLPAMAQAAYDAQQGEGATRIFDGDAATGLMAVRANFPELLRKLKSNPQSIRLELPASVDQDDSTFDAAFWIDLINRQFFWRRFEPTLFLDEAPRQTDRRVFLVFGNPIADDYARVLGLRRQHESFLRPAHTADGSTPAPPLGATPTYAELASTRFVA